MQKLFVVSHAHWDHEWYEPFQVYRARLIRCVDKLLDIFATDPDYRYFLLDGQTIVLEDYLEVRPDRERALRDLVKAGRLQIGPWYVLPDEFLVSGEALIRNLVRGSRIARDFGDTQPVGYIPDPFGHISQMPQILRGLGIDAAVFRRGLADEPTEVAWQAPNGSHVLAWVRENNPKTQVPDRFNKHRQPRGDHDCRRGHLHRAPLVTDPTPHLVFDWHFIARIEKRVLVKQRSSNPLRSRIERLGGAQHIGFERHRRGSIHEELL